MHLSEKQQEALNRIISGQNVFISGPAGSGKSTILAEAKKLDRTLAVTGTTGMAAVNVGGITIHSWGGLGILDAHPETIARNIVRKNRVARDRILETQRLAIDEVSMLNAGALDIIDEVFQLVRRRHEPFGGMQILLFGDFLQLRPVSQSKQKEEMAFKANAWSSIQTVVLHEIFRQEDNDFAAALNDIRHGHYSELAGKLLKTRFRAHDPTAFRNPPVIMDSHNARVDAINAASLEAIPEESRQFVATDSGSESGKALLQKHCQAASTISLKKGARVMLLKNLAQEIGLVNGACGTIPSFSPGGNPIVEFDNGHRETIVDAAWELKDGDVQIATRKQIPLRLAYALTIHKSQGQTLDKTKVHLFNVFEAGQAYVALSRVKTLEGLFIADGDKSCIKADPEAVRFYLEHG